jgi:hypothetical protein
LWWASDIRVRKETLVAALKGAFINLQAGLLGGLPNIVVFQFNPDRITRTPTMVQPPAPASGTGNTDSSQQPGQPAETIGFVLQVDATDLLTGGPAAAIAAASGILPMLSALELLMVPKSALTINLSSLAGSGPAPHQHPPDRLPTVLFFWGPSRIVPVNITSLSVDETEYDTLLNPLRAEVTVSLQVLTPSQLAHDATVAIGAYRYTQGVRETLAALNLANSAQIGVGASLSFSL